MSDPRSKRVQRVERDLFETLSHYLLHGLNEPLPCHASVTAVEINPNLRHAKVFFRLIGDAKEVEAGKEVLLSERHAFQKEVARNTSSKFCPVLRLNSAPPKSAMRSTCFSRICVNRSLEIDFGRPASDRQTPGYDQP